MPFWLGDNASHIAKDGGAITDASNSHPWWKPSRIWNGGFIGATRQKEWHFLKWACLTYFILKQAVLTHGVYKPQILLSMTSRLLKVIAGVQRWMEEACIKGSMFLPNGNKKCDWHALVASA